MNWWIWPLISLAIAITIVTIRLVRKRLRKATGGTPKPLTEEERFGNNYIYTWLRKAEAANTTDELNNLYHQGMGSGAWEELGEEFKDRFESARGKVLKGHYRSRADSWLEIYGHPSDLDTERLDPLYRNLLNEDPEVADLLDLNFEEIRQAVVQRIRDQYTLRVAAMESGNKEDFDELDHFLNCNSSYAQRLGVDDIVRPVSWNQWVAFHFQNPYVGGFTYRLGDAHNEVALRAADALRDNNVVLAKIVLATCANRRGKDTIGEILYAEVIKMVAAHNALDEGRRLAALGLTVLR